MLPGPGPGPARNDEAGELTAAALPRRGRGGQREAAETDTLSSLSLSLAALLTQHTHDTLTHAVTLREGEEKRHRKLTSPSAACYSLKSPRLASGCLLPFLPARTNRPGARCAGAAAEIATNSGRRGRGRGKCM